MRQANLSLGAVAYDQLTQVDPTVVPTFGKRGSVAKKITVPPGLFLKLDNGVSVNWANISSGVSATPSVSVWVDGVNGSNVTGDGTIIKPFQTIQFAIDSIVDASSSKPYSIMILPGVYPEALIGKGYIDLIGQGAVSVTSYSFTSALGEATSIGFNLISFDSVTVDSTLGAGISVVILNGSVNTSLNFQGAGAGGDILFNLGVGVLQGAEVTNVLWLLENFAINGNIVLHPGTIAWWNKLYAGSPQVSLEGQSLLRTLNCQYSGEISGTVIGPDTPEWQTDSVSHFPTILATLIITHLDKYIPANPANWLVSTPTTIYEAIDRLAAYLDSVGGGPVP